MLHVTPHVIRNVERRGGSAIDARSSRLGPSAVPGGEFRPRVSWLMIRTLI